jgi:hypothetical protein
MKRIMMLLAVCLMLAAAAHADQPKTDAEWRSEYYGYHPNDRPIYNGNPLNMLFDVGVGEAGRRERRIKQWIAEQKKFVVGQAIEQAEQKKADDRAAKIWPPVLITTILLSVIAIIKARRGDAVFFYDGVDLALSYAPIVLFIGAVMINNPVIQKWALWGVVIEGFGYHLVRAYLHNRGMIALPMAIFAGRLLVATIAPLVFFSVFCTGSSRQGESAGNTAGLQDTLVTVGIAYVTFRLVMSLINGRVVESQYFRGAR